MQLALACALDAPTDDRTFALQADTGLGWHETGATADLPETLIGQARDWRTEHPAALLRIVSRDPNHDFFVMGWRPHAEIR